MYGLCDQKYGKPKYGQTVNTPMKNQLPSILYSIGSQCFPRYPDSVDLVLGQLAICSIHICLSSWRGSFVF